MMQIDRCRLEIHITRVSTISIYYGGLYGAYIFGEREVVGIDSNEDGKRGEEDQIQVAGLGWRRDIGTNPVLQ